MTIRQSLPGATRSSAGSHCSALESPTSAIVTAPSRTPNSHRTASELRSSTWQRSTSAEGRSSPARSGSGVSQPQSSTA